jgi:hypothetical protein
MSSTAWSWLLAIVGSVASIAGLVFSLMAWVQAAKAKDAAREAVEAVQRRSTAQEFLRLAGDAKELLSTVQQNRTENAISAANALIHALSLVRSRGIAGFPDADTLKVCVREITAVAIRLTVEGIPPDQSKLEELIVLCHGIHRTVCDLAGRMEHLSEGVSS